MLVTERLKAARKECKLTQQQVADILHVDRSTYAYYELGTTTPSVDKLIMLAALFKTDVSWLLGDDIPKNVWRAPENDISLKMQIKERRITELSKDERKLIGLFRVAAKNGNSKEILNILSETVGKTNGEK